MVKFYQLYSYWALLLLILYLLNIIYFSVLPTLVLVFIGQIIIFIYVLSKKQKVNYSLGILLLLFHLIPITLVYTNLITFNDILYNFGIFMVYNISLMFQKTNIIEVYRKITENANISTYKHYQQIFSL